MKFWFNTQIVNASIIYLIVQHQKEEEILPDAFMQIKDVIDYIKKLASCQFNACQILSLNFENICIIISHHDAKVEQ